MAVDLNGNIVEVDDGRRLPTLFAHGNDGQLDIDWRFLAASH